MSDNNQTYELVINLKRVRNFPTPELKNDIEKLDLMLRTKEREPDSLNSLDEKAILDLKEIYLKELNRRKNML